MENQFKYAHLLAPIVTILIMYIYDLFEVVLTDITDSIIINEGLLKGDEPKLIRWISELYVVRNGKYFRFFSRIFLFASSRNRKFDHIA